MRYAACKPAVRAEVDQDICLGEGFRGLCDAANLHRATAAPQSGTHAGLLADGERNGLPCTAQAAAAAARGCRICAGQQASKGPRREERLPGRVEVRPPGRSSGRQAHHRQAHHRNGNLLLAEKQLLEAAGGPRLHDHRHRGRLAACTGGGQRTSGGCAIAVAAATTTALLWPCEASFPAAWMPLRLARWQAYRIGSRNQACAARAAASCGGAGEQAGKR